MRRLVSRAPLLLGRRWMRLATILLAVLLVSPGLGGGPLGDDYMLLARVDPRLHVPEFGYAPFNLFTFVSGDPSERAALMEQGVFGWWMAPDFRMSFWRPFSSLTHLLDHLLWPRSWVLAHVQSMLWFAALLAVLAALYRRFHVPWIAHLALLLYAVDDARGWVLGWVANRNALVAATLAFAALLAHDRARRDGWRVGSWLAPALFAGGLLGGEAALGVTGYLFAHALFLDSGPIFRRLGRLWPYAALSVAWLAAYKMLGYGTSGGGMYLNPLDEPLPYFRALAERLPVLLAAQVGLSMSDVWAALPPPAKAPVYSLAIVVIGAFAALLAPLLRRQPVCRFWALGAVLSLPPLCATYPMDRLLVFAGVGAMATIALIFAERLEGGVFALLPRVRRAIVTIAVSLLAVLHLVLAPLLLPVRVVSVGLLAGMGRSLEASIPRDETIREKTLVILSSSVEMTTFPPWMERQVRGMPLPRNMRVLASCFARLRVSRLDAKTLRVRPEQGLLDNGFLQMVRGLSRPFHPGDEVVLSNLRVRVRDVTADGRPAEVDFEFPVPLEDSTLLWKRVKSGAALIPWTPPAVGESQVLTAVSR
jgi:hypothetical protein